MCSYVTVSLPDVLVAKVHQVGSLKNIYNKVISYIGDLS